MNDRSQPEADVEEYTEQPERPGLSLVLLPLVLVPVLAAVGLVVIALCSFFLKINFGYEWLTTWMSNIQGVMGAFIYGYLLLTFGAVLAGYIGWLGMSSDRKPEGLLGLLLKTGDTAISMGIVAGAALLLTCKRPFMSQFSPDCFMGYVDQTEGFIVRAALGLVFLALSFGLIFLLMRKRNSWENKDYVARKKRSHSNGSDVERYSVTLVYVPIEKKPEVIRLLRQFIGCDPATAKGLVGAAPVKVLVDVSYDDAKSLVEFLLDEDCRAEMVKDGDE